MAEYFTIISFFGTEIFNVVHTIGKRSLFDLFFYLLTFFPNLLWYLCMSKSKICTYTKYTN